MKFRVVCEKCGRDWAEHGIETWKRPPCPECGSFNTTPYDKEDDVGPEKGASGDE